MEDYRWTSASKNIVESVSVCWPLKDLAGAKQLSIEIRVERQTKLRSPSFGQFQDGLVEVRNHRCLYAGFRLILGLLLHGGRVVKPVQHSS